MKIMKMEDVLKIRGDLHLVRHIIFYIISNKFDSPVGDTKIYIYKVTDRFLYNYWQSKQNYPKPKVRNQQIKYVLHGEYVNKLENKHLARNNNKLFLCVAMCSILMPETVAIPQLALV